MPRRRSSVASSKQCDAMPSPARCIHSPSGITLGTSPNIARASATVCSAVSRASSTTVDASRRKRRPPSARSAASERQRGEDQQLARIGLRRQRREQRRGRVIGGLEVVDGDHQRRAARPRWRASRSVPLARGRATRLASPESPRARKSASRSASAGRQLRQHGGVRRSRRPAPPAARRRAASRRARSATPFSPRAPSASTCEHRRVRRAAPARRPRSATASGPRPPRPRTRAPSPCPRRRRAQRAAVPRSSCASRPTSAVLQK